jgi:uncharacterized coiled-coil protein SlyX
VKRLPLEFNEDLLRMLECQVALLQKKVETLSDILIDHISHKGEIIQFKEKLREFDVEEEE